MISLKALRNVQALRAVAALLVVAQHAADVYHTRVVPGISTSEWPNGAAGVDVFFVVSGLVMVISSERLRDCSDGWRVFLRHRFVRILPLFWIMMIVKIALVAAMPAMALRTQLHFGYVVASFLLLPVHDASGAFQPVLPVSWTLTFEMMFYGLFALALFLRVPVLRFVTPILAALALAALARTSTWPAIGELANTMVLEFALGAWIGTLALHGRIAPPGAAILLLVVGFGIMLSIPYGPPPMRLIVWGLPAAAIVAGAIGLERIVAPHLPRWLLSLGDASYAIYLTHAFVIPVVGVLVAKFNVASGLALPETMVGGIVLSALAGVVVHRVVEQPLLILLRRRPPAAAIIAG